MRTKNIPLYKGGRRVAFAIVDEGDAYWLQEWIWRVDSNGYVLRTGPLGSRSAVPRMHREILGLADGDPRKGDHINGDKLDNRRSNLRIVTVAQNNQNVAARRRTSQYRGVCLGSDGRWRASVGTKPRAVWLGRFPTELEAAKAVARWRAANMPFSVEDPSLLQ